MQICQNCGAGNPDNARFCRHCGGNMALQVQQNVPNGGGRQQPDPRNRRQAQQGNRAQYAKTVQRRPQQTRHGKRSRRESSNTGLTVVMCLAGALAAVLIIGAAILLAVHLAG